MTDRSRDEGNARADANAYPDGNTNADGHAQPTADADGNADSHADANADGHADADASADADVDADASADTTGKAPSLVVGIGASAGGIAACKDFFAHAPTDVDIAYIVVLHLSPGSASHLDHILQTVTTLPVEQAQRTGPLEANHVYVIAPATALAVEDGTLAVVEPDEPHARALPIDALFASLAESGHRTAAIVLSGTGRDGCRGLERIRDAGGLCLVQDPETAEYTEMPDSAVDTGAADAVVPTSEMGEILRTNAEQFVGPGPAERPRAAATPKRDGGEPRTADDDGGGEPRTADDGGEPRTDDDGGLAGVLDVLGQRYGVDFARDYKKGTLERRTERRITMRDCDGWDDYRAYLRTHPDEVEALYRDFLIDVTEFFRDRDHWRYLEQEAVPTLIESHDANTPLRVWSAGCATGEEAYGLAMLFREQLRSRESPLDLRVFASDLSREALAFAREGLYPASIEKQVSSERLARFFRREGDGYRVSRTLRDTVTFAAHDLLSDPPFPKIDLVSCRNVLIYLQPRAQQRLLDLLRFALRPGGLLWLGSAESVGRRGEIFDVMSRTYRVYRATGPARLDRQGGRRWRGRKEKEQPSGRPSGPDRAARRQTFVRQLEQLALRRYTTACVAIDRNSEILYFFGPTDAYLTRPPGEARMDILSWAHPALYAKLRGAITTAFERNEPVTVSDLRLERAATTARVELVVEPLPLGQPGELFLVRFRDLSEAPQTRTEDVGDGEEPLTRQLAEELRATRQDLQSSVEELETANEQYQASHEELLSLNEELQSSNEELETSKEELQSVNEELTTINRQLEEKNAELHSLTSDINNLLVSSEVPTLLLDREQRIRRFTPASTSILRITKEDVGRSLERVRLRVADEALFDDVRRVLDDPSVETKEVRADDGRWFVRRVLPYRTTEGRIDGVCITFHDVDAQKRAAVESEEARTFADAIIRASRTALLVLDAELKVISANEAFRRTFEVDAAEVPGQTLFDLGEGQLAIPRLQRLLGEVLPREKEIRNYEVEDVFGDLGRRTLRLNGSVLTRADKPALILVSIEDVTDLRSAQAEAQARSDDLVRDHERKDEFLAMLGHELRNPLSALVSGVNVIRMTAGIPDRVEQIAAMMERQAKRIATMLDELLDVSRVISGKLELAREEVDLVEAVEAAIEAVSPMIESSRQKLTVSFLPKGTALILGDGIRLTQVAENLIGNAVKYTDDGGHIWLAIRATEDTVELSVRDEGVGMEPYILEHAFELFTQAPRNLHRAKGGLGLGLPLVRSLVEMHRGRVEAFSEGLGHGTELVVTLPRLPATSRRSTERADEGDGAEAPAVAPRRVLVVEDEEDAAATLVDILSLRGHRVQTARDGPVALEHARRFRPEVVLLDLGLPGMDGYEVAEKIRSEHGPDPLLVAMTGYQRDDARLEAAGFDDHLLKPPDLDRLFALLAEAPRQS